MNGSEIIDLGGRLLLAGVLGALLGVEREVRGHAAGAKTQALVAVGAALFTLIGSGAFQGDAVDSSRVAAQVVSGIGFIGAGVILRNGFHVRGLTTAATLWVSAALGIAAGAGQYQIALLGGAIALGFVYGLRFVKPFTRRARRTIHVEYQLGHGTLGPLIRELEQIEGVVENLRMEDEHDEVLDEPVRRVEITVNTRRDDRLQRLLVALERRPEVHYARLEDG